MSSIPAWQEIAPVEDVILDVSEDGLASALRDKYQDVLRYCDDWHMWMRWDGVKWTKENTLLVYDYSRGVCRQAAKDIEKPSAKMPLLRAATVAAVERLARADRALATTADRWDCDPWQLNSMSGVIDLKTGKILPHDRVHYHTKCSGTKLGNGKPELWLSFLDRVTGGDLDRQDYLQRLCGYFLTGLTIEQILAFLYGSGANGKSVFTAALQGVLGDYAKQTAEKTFCETRSDQHPCDIAMLQSVRLALASETEKHSRFSEARLKQLTGGDKIAARFMRGDFFEYTPQFKILISGNHRPTLSSTDEAIRRRLHLIPFDVTIPAAERDPRLSEKLKAEWPDILRWMLDGCLLWQKVGLKPPQSVIDATTEYLESEDKLGRWLSDCCLLGQRECRASDAFENYKRWCTQTNEEPGTQKAFSQELLAREGIENKRTKYGSSFTGFGLKSDQQEHDYANRD